MKKLYMTILILITVACVILGIMIHGLAFLFNLGRIAGNNEESTALGNISQTVDATMITEDYDVSEFTSMDLDFGRGNVTFTEGGSYSVSYTGIKEMAPTVKNEKDGKLTVKQSNKNWRSLIGSSDSLGRQNSLTITVPKDTKLKKVKAELGMGDFSISGLTADDADLDLDMGNLNMKDCVFANLDIDSDMGNVTIDGMTASEIDLDADMGNIEASNVGSFKKLDMDADLGNIEVSLQQGLNDLALELSTDLGSITVNGDKMSSKVKTGSGSSRVRASANLGSIKITTE